MALLSIGYQSSYGPHKKDEKENINYFYYSLIYESYLDESLLKFENEEEEIYYLKQELLMLCVIQMNLLTYQIKL